MKSLFMEIRPRLQSVNVFSHFDEELGDNVAITLEPQHFTVSTDSGDNKIDVFQYRIVKNSLGCVKVKNKTVSFRFLTENLSSHRGSSKVEFIQLPESNSVLNLTFLKPNLSYDLLCFKCNHVFSKDVKFERVLPLPDSDMNDFFCHPTAEGQKTLVPKLNDIFYFDCFGHVNEGILNCKTDEGSNLVCQNCLEWIGTRLSSGSYKIWFNTVIFVNGEERHVSTPLDDVIKSIRFALETNKFSYLRKLLINCKHSEKFVLLWVLEDKLQLKTLTFDGYIAKVLFKFEESKSEMVDKWAKDSSVYELDVSKSMFEDLLNHLREMNSCMPDDFKESNGFNVSYLGKM